MLLKVEAEVQVQVPIRNAVVIRTLFKIMMRFFTKQTRFLYVACRITVLFSIFSLLILACAPTKPPPTPSGYPKPYKTMGKWYQPVPDAKNYKERGIASWYGKPFHGRKTSNGEIYNMHALTAAHKTLPFDTLVRVKNLDNNKKIDVRINDRGPFVHKRIIDLSYSAAQKLGVVIPGTAKVEITAIGIAIPSGGEKDAFRPYTPVDFYQGSFTFQVGAFRDRKNAQRQRGILARKYKNAHIAVHDSGDGIYYRVRVGRVSNLEEAIRQEDALIKDGFHDVFIVAE